MKNIPIANSVEQTGCLIAFDTVGPDFNAASLRRGREWDGENFVPREPDGKIIGFNPVTGDKSASTIQAHDAIAHRAGPYGRYADFSRNLLHGILANDPLEREAFRMV